jgi:hypothetical protein
MDHLIKPGSLARGARMYETFVDFQTCAATANFITAFVFDRFISFGRG